MTNPVIDSLMNHRSVRRFKSKPIEPEKLDLILNAGIRAATAGNLQQYSLIVIDDVEKKRALWDSPVVEAPTMIIAVVDEYRMKRWVELSDAPFYFNHVVNLFIGFWDAIIALHNIVVAAESLGLGTCYMGTVLSVDIQRALGTPEYVFPAGMVWLGYPDESPELRSRLPLEAVVHRNGYHVPTDDKIRAFYHEKNQEWWEELSEERKRYFRERGISNKAQERTIGHYTEQFIKHESKRILENLEKAKFKLTVE
ncbi:MAG: nitroreductase family protein [Anaerolineae bacterium]